MQGMWSHNSLLAPHFGGDCSTWTRQLQNTKSQPRVWGKMAVSKLSLCHELTELNSTFPSGCYPHTFYFCTKYSKYWAFTVQQSCALKPTAKIISIKTQPSAHLSWPGSLNPTGSSFHLPLIICGRAAAKATVFWAHGLQEEEKNRKGKK